MDEVEKLSSTYGLTEELLVPIGLRTEPREKPIEKDTNLRREFA